MREACVAGQFYPSDKEELISILDGMIGPQKDKIKVLGAVVPHAGYIYSGSVAGAVYDRIAKADTYVIIGPNHTGLGASFASLSDTWRTPLGEVNVDTDLLGRIKAGTSLITEDITAHVREHSVEVQIPFIQRTAPGSKIVPITVKYGEINELKELAKAIASAIKGTKKNVTILASSDMTHYESRRSAKLKDKTAIQKILDMDPEGLKRTVEKEDISMCGYVPAVIMLESAILLGANKAELVKYADSGDVTKNTNEVVGYAGLLVY